MQVLVIFLFIVGALFLFLAFRAKDKVKYYEQVVQNIYKSEVLSQKRAEQATPKRKTKEQVDLELLVVKNTKPLFALAMIDKNIKFKLIIATVIAVLALLIFGVSNPLYKLVVCLISFIAGLVLPGMIANMMLKRRIRTIMEDLPMFIDLTAICVQTGMPIDSALKRVADEYEQMNPTLTYVMRNVLKKAELTSLVQALGDLAIALPAKEVRMFTTTMQQSLNFGSSIYGQLIQLSADIREYQLLVIEEKLGTLSAKMSIPLILFIMFPIIILILAPGAMQIDTSPLSGGGF